MLSLNPKREEERKRLEEKMKIEREKLMEDFQNQKFLGLSQKIKRIQQNYELMRRV